MKTLGLTLVLAALPFVAAAQDPVKVAPGHYKVLIDNPAVRVLKVDVPAGAKSSMHSHPDALVVLLMTGNARYTMPDGKTVDTHLTKETATFIPATRTRGPTSARARSTRSWWSSRQPAPARPRCRPRARASSRRSRREPTRRRLQDLDRTGLPGGRGNDPRVRPGGDRPRPGSLTLVVEGKTPVTKWQRGDVQFIGRGVKHSAKNTGGKPVEVIIVAIR